MSLLLDALKSESNTAVEEPEEHAQPEEQPLDAHATLELLAPKPAASELLTLEPPAAGGSTTAAPAVAAPEPIGAPEPIAEMARSPPISARSPLPLAERASEPNAPQSDAGARPAAPALDAAALAARRKKRYGLLLVAIIAVAGIAMLGKSWWRPGANSVSYPEGGESQSQPAAPIDTAPTASSLHAVQVPSARPPDQFAYTGDAPEIDLRASAAADASGTSANNASFAAAAPDAPAAAIPAAGSTTARAATAVRSRNSTLSVTRAQGLSPIDGHVQAGYRALAAGDVANARNEYLAAVELDPNNVDALMGAAAVAVRDGKPAAAAQRYAAVLKLEPGNPDATAAMAMLHQGEGAGETEESRLKILIATDSSRPALHAALGGVYAADGRWTEAAQEYFTALARDPGNPDLAFNVAASLDQNRSAAMALTYYQQALEFAHQRPAQIDLRAVERRVKQLQAHAKEPPVAPEAP